MNQEEQAAIFDIDTRTLRRWLSGEAGINGSATVLLRLLRAGRITLDDCRAALAQSPDTPQQEEEGDEVVPG
jgi:transcriptional regulator with XRE-family HTH domain